jgi:DNA adenine methylase
MKIRTHQPVIKWSGSKRSVAQFLSKLWPTVSPSACYYEPFVGGGSMLPVRPIARGKAGDSIKELIDLWTEIRDHPNEVVKHYSQLWHQRQSEGHTVFYRIRERFNKNKNPLDLFFLSRTCVNGLIRFNTKGEFNNSLHHTRPGIHPDRLSEIVQSWSKVLSGVEFLAGDYRLTLSSVKKGDLVFLDPPYVGTKGRYHPGAFDFEAFYQELQRLNSIGVNWILTLDGKAGARVYKDQMPASLYSICLAIPTGNSPFTRLMNTSLDGVVESVYFNFDPPIEALSSPLQKTNQQTGSRLKDNMEYNGLLF